MDGWIKKTDRLPTEDDCDPLGCILVWHSYQKTLVYGLQGFLDNRLMTHWQRTPDAPMEYQENENAP